MPTVFQQLQTLPAKSGVYLFKDTAGNCLYVGKATNLRTRIRSYFHHSFLPTPHNLQPHKTLDPAKHKMVSKIASIDTIICDNETEALILEANLINKHQPTYNVILRDDKFYLFIKITTGEKFPRVYPVRRLDKKSGNRYFGPYSSAHSVRATLRLLQRLFPHRTEKDSPLHTVFPHPLFNSQKPKTAHCPLPTNHYKNNIQNIIRFLQGQRREIEKTLKKGMKAAAQQKQYEKAALYRDQLQAIQKLDSRQKVFLSRPESFDTVSLARGKNTSAANVFSIRHGKLLNKNTFILKHRPHPPRTDILRQFLLQYYNVSQNIPSLILLPFSITDQDTIINWLNKNTNSEHGRKRKTKLIIPQRGRKKQLIKLGEKNAKQLLASENLERITKLNHKKALKNLADTLNISAHLKRIETYDISNLQGRLSTGSMVVFTDGHPDKAQYRKFRIKLIPTPNDYLMLEEVLTRRLRHLKESVRDPKKRLPASYNPPNLIIIDGGKGQLSTTKKVLDKLNLDIPIAALAKKEETLFAPMYTSGVYKGAKKVFLPLNSPALILLQQMRDEAHRFTISYHQLLRRHKQNQSVLDEIPGIGPKTKKKLISHFGSLQKIRAASDQKLIKLIGSAKTKKLRDFL